MKCYNTIIILNPGRDKILFCKRRNDPYEGLYNFVGGKIEEGETSEEAAYRELQEETGISEKDVKLFYFMDFVWHLQDMRMEVYAGVLKHDVSLQPEKHPLCWLGFEEDFFDMTRFAGEGNLGHMLEILKISKEIFGPRPLSLEELKAENAIYLERVEDGWNHFRTREQEGKEEQQRKFLLDMIDRNGWENSYVDFYYGRLTADEKQKVHSVLERKEIQYLENRYFTSEQIYFQLTRELFEITCHLSLKEMLFSTYYFTGVPCTVWTSYGKKFFIFEK